MKTLYHAADSRGYANHGWLKSHHSFSFAQYNNPERMGFGALRVINDDLILGGHGFGMHPHRDMEIISIPLSGRLSHRDNTGNHGVIKSGEIQVMSAGSGISHSEMNGDDEKPVTLLQIWVLPNKSNVKPRYQQLYLADLMKPNTFNQVLSPHSDDAGVWIHQNAWFSMGHFEQGTAKTYQLQDNNNGVYLFVISGRVSMNGRILSQRDGLGIWATREFTVDFEQDAHVLVMEVPMHV